MAIPKLKVTKRGARELSGPGEVIITKVGFGHNYETDMERASISGVTSIASFQPTVTQEGDYQIIDVTFDNENTGKAQYSNTFIKTIAIIAKKGANGEEFILYGGSDLQGVHVQPNSFGAPHQLLQFVFKVRLSGDANITIQASELPGLATADSVNRVSEALGKLKSGTSIEQALDLPGLKVLLGSTGKQRAPQDLDTLGTPGIYWYEQSHNASSKGIASGYGFILVFSNMVGSTGQSGNFTWQVFYGTNGRIWVRTRVNNGAWSVQPVASGEYLTNTLKRLGLDEWGLGFNIATCSSGTNFGTFLSSSAVPIGFSIVRDANPPAKELFVWKASNSYAYAFAPMAYNDFFVGSLSNGVWRPFTNLAQTTKLYQSQRTQDFGDYLRSGAVPVGLSMHKDAKTGAFGQVTKVDNNNVFFTGALREQGKTYQVAYAVVDGVKPSAFTKWALT